MSKRVRKKCSYFWKLPPNGFYRFLVVSLLTKCHKTLSLDEKLQIFEKLGSHTHRQLSEEYGVGVSTIADTKKKGSKLREHKCKLTEMGCRRPVKTMIIGNFDNRK